MRVVCSRQVAVTLGFVVAALGIVTPAARAGAEGNTNARPRVTYLGSDVAGSAAAGSGACDDAVVKGLQRTGITFVAIDPAKVPRTAEGLVCAGPACLDQAAATSGAVYFVRAEARKAEGTSASSTSIEGKVQVFRAQPFQAVSSGDFVCDDCTAETLAQRFEQRATDAMVKALALRPPDAVVEAAAGGTAAEAPAGPPRVGPWIAIGAGAALAVTGVVLIARGDQSLCTDAPASKCGKTYSDARTGFLLGGVGAAAILGGVAWGWLIGGQPGGGGGTPQVSLLGIGPGGVTVGGRF